MALVDQLAYMRRYHDRNSIAVALGLFFCLLPVVACTLFLLEKANCPASISAAECCCTLPSPMTLAQLTRKHSPSVATMQALRFMHKEPMHLVHHQHQKIKEQTTEEKPEPGSESAENQGTCGTKTVDGDRITLPLNTRGQAQSST